MMYGEIMTKFNKRIIPIIIMRHDVFLLKLNTSLEELLIMNLAKNGLIAIIPQPIKLITSTKVMYE